jgi:hypothetical protein
MFSRGRLGVVDMSVGVIVVVGLIVLLLERIAARRREDQAAADRKAIRDGLTQRPVVPRP